MDLRVLVSQIKFVLIIFRYVSGLTDCRSTGLKWFATAAIKTISESNHGR